MRSRNDTAGLGGQEEQKNRESWNALAGDYLLLCEDKVQKRRDYTALNFKP